MGAPCAIRMTDTSSTSEAPSVDDWLDRLDAQGLVLVFPEDGRDPIAELDDMIKRRTHPTIGWVKRNTERSTPAVP